MVVLFPHVPHLLLTVQDFYGNWASWQLICILAVVTSIIIYTVMWMLGRAFSIRDLEVFAKSEMLQAAATALMVIFLVMLVDGSLGIAQQFIGGAGAVTCGSTPMNIGAGDAGTTMDDAYDAIRCKLQERTVQVAQMQEAANRGMWAYFLGLNTAISFFGITAYKGDWSSSLYKATETARIVNNLTTVLLIGLNAQSALIQYIKANMLHVFIPVGILLRSFYLTRGPGALLISIGIGLYFIFPTFYVLLDPGFVPAEPPQVSLLPQQQAFCYPTMSSTVTLLNSVENAGLGSSASLSLASMRSELAKSYISLILHPLIAFFLTMVFVRYMMTVLGGDTYELTKMVTKLV